ncbi:MAG: DEAD/DEAH box helicase [Actinomycetales bacterium]|nr:DEAD/DEAH box helicase [Actinomycetales bacterium]
MLKRRPIPENNFQASAAQAAAIAHRNKPLVITGGPGSGKTSVLIEAAIARINEGQDPNSILVLTFGRERASELRDAIALRTSQTMLEPLARTFHALAHSILKAEGHNPILLSGPEQEGWIRQLVDGVEWPDELKPALHTRGFVRELRDLMLRATERGWTPSDLEANGKKYKEEFWIAASKFWKSYIGTLILVDADHGEPKERLDSAQLVWRAANVTRNAFKSQFKTILIDEFQESDKAQRALLSNIATDDIVIAVDPYTTVGRFRGADPDGLNEALAPYLAKGESIHLSENFRASSATHLFLEKIAGEFPKAPEIQSSRGEIAGSVIAECLIDGANEAAFIADKLQRAHLESGLKWSDMAVIFRSPAQSGSVRNALMRYGIPVAGELQVLSENASIAPFLLLAESAIAGKLDLNTAEILLTSEFGGADSISLRRIRRELVAKYSSKTGLSGSELICKSITDGEFEIPSGEALLRVHELFNLAERTARKKSAQPEDLLWEIWSNAKTSDNQLISDAWRNRALKGGIRGANADRDLDAMLQLFESARRFGQRFKYANLGEFFKDIRKSEIAGDVITAKGQRPDVVELLTPFSAKGREWNLVVVAGVQEGIWPNLRIRGSLLGSERLAERDRNPDLAAIELELVAKAAVSVDELRLFYAAISRASQDLIITAVDREEDQPSTYFDLAYEFCNPSDELETKRSVNRAGNLLSSANVVSKLRRDLLQNKSEKAAATLKSLAAAGISGAAPEDWYGAKAISSDAPAIPEDQEVRVSPSGVEKFDECQLRWFLESHGGQDGNTTAQLIGTVIHKFAELAESNETNLDSQIELLTANWKLVDPETGWISRTSMGRAVLMLKRFYKYRESMAGKRDFKESEAAYKFKVGRAYISCKIDRIETTVDGKLYIVDFKTGKSAISVEDAKTDAQMQIYQYAAGLEGAEVAGASLVYLDHDLKGNKTRDQLPINREDVEERIEKTAVLMGGKRYLAVKNSNCQFCNVSSSCPLQIEGRGLYE